MPIKSRVLAQIAILAGTYSYAHAESINIATVNNADMIIMQKLSPQWEKQTGNKINWIVLEENVLRQRVTTDIATKGGQFDLVTIGAYEAPIWGKAGWLTPLDDLPNYDYPDVFQSVRNGLSSEGKLFAVPFYAESALTFYRKDLFAAAGLKMPEQPTYGEIKDFADKLTDKSKAQYGICLRGKPGWGENVAILTPMVNTFGGAWFDMNWQPQLTSQPWHKAMTFYVDLMKADGPLGITSNGYNETLSLFASGHCAMWIDGTSAAGRLYDPKQSQVADQVGFAKAPIEKVPSGAALAWSWALALPASSQKQAVARDFARWATSKEYVQIVGKTEGWIHAPPGTRESTYANADYQQAAPFAADVKKAILTADPAHPTADPVPYTGVQFVAIPQFQAIGTILGQQFAAALAGTKSVDEALQASQAATEEAMKHAGYFK